MTDRTTTISLRQATVDDAPTLLALMQRAFAEYVGVLDPPSGVHRETVESVRNAMETGVWVLAENRGTRVGCVMYEWRGYRVIRYEAHAGYMTSTFVTMEKLL
jgi:hypothetical protein